MKWLKTKFSISKYTDTHTFGADECECCEFCVCLNGGFGARVSFVANFRWRLSVWLCVQLFCGWLGMGWLLWKTGAPNDYGNSHSRESRNGGPAVCVCVCVKITDDDSRWEQNFVNNMFSRVFASPSIVCSLLRVTDANDCFCECWCWRNQSFTRMHTAHMLQVRLIKYMANDGFHCKIAHCFRSRADQPSGGPCFPNTWISWLSW